MALNLYSAANEDGLFNLLGKAYYVLTKLFESYGSIVPGAVENYIIFCNKLADKIEVAGIYDDLPAATGIWKTGDPAFAAAIQESCRRLVLKMVGDDIPAFAERLEDALRYVVAEMVRQSHYVAKPVLSATITAAPSNSGPQPSIVYSLADDRGAPVPLVIPETMQLIVQEDRRYLRVEAGPSEDLLSPLWPKGSDADQALAIQGPQESLVPDGDFEQAAGDVPEDWLLTLGTEGTHVALTDPEEQTVTISGSPTGGWYALQYTDADGVIWTTAMLPFDATGTQVQAALHDIPDLADVTVSTSGTSPNYTHTIVFRGLGGDIAQLTSINRLTGGTPTITHATTVPGDPNSRRGRTLKLISDGATLTTLHAPLELAPETTYVLHLWALKSGATTAGAIQLAVVDGIDGTVTRDDYGNENKISLDVVNAVGTTYKAFWAPVRVKKTQAGRLYLQVKVTTAPADGVSVYLDDIFLVPAQRLYQGGPAMAVLRAERRVKLGQAWTVQWSNDRAGKLLEWTHRVFSLDELGLTLPTMGTTLIPDSVIS